MAIFVVDASAALAWCFEDEANTWTEGLLERLREGDRIRLFNSPTLVRRWGRLDPDSSKSEGLALGNSTASFGEPLGGATRQTQIRRRAVSCLDGMAFRDAPRLLALAFLRQDSRQSDLARCGPPLPRKSHRGWH